MARMRMNNVDDFMRETSIHAEQYNDGLILKGEFVRHCLDNLQILMKKDLEGAQRTIEGYGYDGNSFSTWMHEQAGKE